MVAAKDPGLGPFGCEQRPPGDQMMFPLEIPFFLLLRLVVTNSDNGLTSDLTLPPLSTCP